MRGRRVRALLALGLGLAAAVGFASCSAELGDLPAKCSPEVDPPCPDGYDCIHGVCAKPGTAIPSTLTTLQYLRPVDLRIVPQERGALVAWQIYRYDIELHDFAAARVSPDGSASAAMTLVAEYPANANYLEPYFDLLPVDDRELLLAVGAAPFDADPEPRLTQFAVHLPAPGQERSGASADQLWELRMRTLGYGAVSRPRLARDGDRVALTYFESAAEEDATVGDLASFLLTTDGERLSAPACEVPSCCQANGCFGTRDGTSVAVGLVDAFVEGDDVWWIIDDTRPSFVRLPFDAATPPEGGSGGGGGDGGADASGSGGGGGTTEPATTTSSTGAATSGGGGAPAIDPDAPPQGALPRLAVPVATDGDTLLFLQPSPRGGQGLADDPVDGVASLWRMTLDATGAPTEPVKIGGLPEVRDTPRPVWIARDGKPALLVTPGAAIDGRSILVYEVDTRSAKATRVAAIDRLADLPIAVVQAVVVGGDLYVAWVDESADSAAVRAAVLPVP